MPEFKMIIVSGREVWIEVVHTPGHNTPNWDTAHHPVVNRTNSFGEAYTVTFYDIVVMDHSIYDITEGDHDIVAQCYVGPREGPYVWAGPASSGGAMLAANLAEMRAALLLNI